MNIYKKRIEKLSIWMKKQDIDAVVVQDSENRRSRNLFYLCGMESDGILFVFSNGKTILIAWDVILAEKTAVSDQIIAYTDFDRNFVRAVKEICFKHLKKGRLEVSSSTSHVLFKELSNELSNKINNIEVVCRADGLSEQLLLNRSIKDDTEIEIYKRAGKITNKLIKKLENGFESGKIKTELDAAMLVETESRLLGAEGSSFETLAAGPSRSWGIHCVPAYGAGKIGTKGLSIVDCGLKLEGYATDITITICSGTLSKRQQTMVSLTKEAHLLAAEEAKKTGITAAQIAKKVDDFFHSAGWNMPHGLGHGIGLDVHEAPILKNNAIYDKALKPGMLFTIEPGLYHAEAGGVRLENDYLMTNNGAVAITESKIIYLPERL